MSSGLRARLNALRRFLSRLSVRLLAFNLLLVFLPLGGVFYLNVYEQQLLDAQEQAMVAQGRLLAAALSGSDDLDPRQAREVLRRLDQQTTVRLQVIDGQGRLLADSASFGPRLAPGARRAAAEPDLRSRWLYRFGATVYHLAKRLMGSPEPPSKMPSPEVSGTISGTGEMDLLHGPEVAEALEGRYGSATRITPGEQRSVTLYSALPIVRDRRVLGAVLVSQSTFRLLQSLYEVRLAIGRIFLGSMAVVAILSLIVSTTIAQPLRRLRHEASAILDSRGRLTRLFGTFERRDEIGELSQALAELSRRLKHHMAFIESFAADVSHEFKNPLASIRSATELLAESEDDTERRRFHGMVEGEIARMEHLLTTVGEITSIDAHLDQEDLARVDLNHLLARWTQGFRQRSPTEIALELSLPSDTVSVRACPDRLVQVLDNVVGNAVSFSPTDSTIRLQLTREDATAVVTVSDGGPGIPPEHLDRVFDRFFTYRVGQAAGHRAQHTGLGLAIVKAIVEGYGGSVTAENRPAGGASFEIRLPQVPSTAFGA